MRRVFARLAPPRPLGRSFAGEAKSRTLLETLKERGAARLQAGGAGGGGGAQLHHEPPPDSRATNTQILQNMLKRGERGTAERVLRRAMLQVRERTGVRPLEALHEAVVSAAPLVNVKSRPSAARGTCCRSR